MLREAIVLAAGLGERFRGKEHKLLVKIFGYHLVEYPIRSIAVAGISKFLVVTNSLLLEKLDPILRRARKSMGLEVEFVVNNEIRRGNAYSLVLGLTNSREIASLVTVADHIYPATLVERILRGYSGVPLAVGGDRAPVHIDIAEATLVKTDHSGVIESIGKKLESWNYVDTGLHVVSAVVLGHRRYCGEEGELASLYQCLSRVTRRGVVIDVTGSLWKDVDTWGDYLSIVGGGDRVVAASAIESWRK